MERDTYRQRLARFLKVDESALGGRQAAGSRARPVRKPLEKAAPETTPAPLDRQSGLSPAHKVEAHVLGMFLRRPDLLNNLDRALEENMLGRMSPADFGYTDHQLLFRLVSESLEQDSVEPERYLVDSLPTTLAGLMGSLMEASASLDPVDDRLLEDLFRSTLALRRRIVDDSVGQLRYLIEEDQLMAATYHQMVMQYTRTRQLLDQARLIKNGRK